MSEDNNAPNTGEVETTNQSAVSDGNLTNHNNPNDLETPTPMAQSLEMVHEFGAGEMPEEDNEGYAITHAGTGCFILSINIHSLVGIGGTCTIHAKIPALKSILFLLPAFYQ